MIPITVANATEYQAHQWVTEASTLGLRPGHWPLALPTTLGNGQMFVRKREERDNDNDITAVVYEQDSGCISIRIYND